MSGLMSSSSSIMTLHRIKLAPLDKVIEQTRVHLEGAVDNLFYQLLEFEAPSAREQGDTGAFDGRVAYLHNLCGRQIGNQADALCRRYVKMPSKTSGQVKGVQIIESNAVFVEHDAQAGYVCAFGLSQLADVRFAEINRLISVSRQCDAVVAICESAQSVDSP